MQIRPIRTDKDHRAALAEIEKLWGASSRTPEGDKLDILVTLVETYEERRWPIKSRRRFDPVDLLHYAIEELGHTQAELADILGSRSRASEVLARRRPLTLEMIQKTTQTGKSRPTSSCSLIGLLQRRPDGRRRDQVSNQETTRCTL
jgi:HTH-type transcriptional regulator/antitoxin HigA